MLLFIIPAGFILWMLHEFVLPVSPSQKFFTAGPQYQIEKSIVKSNSKMCLFQDIREM